MTKPYDVLTFMDVCVDLLICGGDVVPRFGQAEQLVGDYSIELGGSCCIFASQTAKLQLNTVGVGFVGDDAFGELVLARLQESGMIMDYVKKDKSCKTGLGIALCDVNDRAILTYTGSIDAIGPDNIPETLFSLTRHLHIGSYYLMKSLQPHLRHIVQKAKQSGMTISLDTNWDPQETWDDGIWDILPYVDIFLPNVNELKAIAKQETVEESIQVLKEFVPLIVVKEGAKGAFAYNGGKYFRAEPLKDIQPIDSVGAGDSFNAGFVYAFLSGHDIQECLRIGNYCGGMSTTKAGGIAGQVRIV
ncbi:carbohydrate kinase family protein [Paenibacillus eucommiae]|uniref:Sugar/nucleoside kinase (Ribokinase family) n=1 Tax=Paenibacillus eucommiae TaxID=1355755 RepID=A0ABS4IQS3_9BACL|nr:sugar kinase [Paenibacillus eucommiae]MBP1989925.1 sugar/nucleoside kinase (ribokinase family) [Paenibacillus eucommiae]